MSISKAEALIARAGRERKDRVKRHLLVAAALNHALGREAIVVGGVAEDFWAAGVYQETDLDLCVPLDDEGMRALDRLGFEREGRHWYSAIANVAVEFPDSTIDGDLRRVVRLDMRGGHATIIGLDDLYLDRVRQATANDGAENDIAFQGALAVAAARYEEMDWPYVKDRIAQIISDEKTVGESMKRIDRRIRRRARLAAAGA